VQIVVDASVILAVLLEEPERAVLVAATLGAELLAPASLPWEVGNALVAAVRRRRLTRDQARAAWTGYEAVPLRLIEIDIGEAIETAIDIGLYAYDGYLVSLARSRGLPLLTLDSRLMKIASGAGVQLLEV
jgi:predicted nucleic acid-binding protein